MSYKSILIDAIEINDKIQKKKKKKYIKNKKIKKKKNLKIYLKKL